MIKKENGKITQIFKTQIKYEILNTRKIHKQGYRYWKNFRRQVKVSKNLYNFLGIIISDVDKNFRKINTS